MSLREVPPSRPLLARKGAASPANLRAVKGGLSEPTGTPAEGDREEALDLVIPETAAAAETGEPGGEASPAASLLPFDLLRKKFRPDLAPDLVEDEPDIVVGELAADERAETWRLRTSPQAELALHEKSAPIALNPSAPAILRAAPAAGPRLDPRPEPKPESKPEPKVDHRLEPGLDVPGPGAPAQAASAPAAPAPKPDPDWRVGVAVAEAPKRSSSGGGWLWPLGALAAAFAALVFGWSLTNPPGGLVSRDVPVAAEGVKALASSPPAGEAAAPVAVPPPPPVTTAEVPKSPPPAAAAAPESPAPSPVAQPLPQSKLPEAKLPEAQQPDSKLPESAAPAAALAVPNLSAPLPSPAAPAVVKLPAPGTAAQPDAAEPAAVKPSVDVVRLDASGGAVIAGRAAPNAELIILDNGKPIGTVVADSFGEWVFVPDTALPVGDHEFGLVLKTVQESVSMPAPATPPLPPAPALAPAPADPAGDAPSVPDVPKAAPAPEPQASTGTAPVAETTTDPAAAPAGDGAAKDDVPAAVSAPLPVRKPAVERMGAAPGTATEVAQTVAVASTADFMVQLASVKTRDGATQEWRKLQRKFPEILADMVPALDEVKLADYGTVVRVRTGAFSNQQDAASLCARLALKNQECLVVRVSTED